MQTGGGVTYYSTTAAGPATCVSLSPVLKSGFLLTSANGKHTVQCRRTAPGAITITVTTSAGVQAVDVPDQLVPVAEDRVTAKIDALSAKLDAINAALKAQFTAYISASAKASAAQLEAVTRPLIQQTQALIQKTQKISYEERRDILTLSVQRIRSNNIWVNEPTSVSLTGGVEASKTIMAQFCDDDPPSKAPTCDNGFEYPYNPFTCNVASGYWDGAACRAPPPDQSGGS